jgi:hypothetical protein
MGSKRHITQRYVLPILLPFLALPVVADVTIRNLRKIGSTVTADIASNQGNVDVCRCVDLADFGTEPILANLPSGIGVVIDPSAPQKKAFYVFVPTGDPAPLP